MSVLKKQRSESQLEFYHTATLIRADLTRFVMNEKIVPKRWRPVFTFPMIEKVIQLVDCITAANTIYPQNLHEFELRRDSQTEAIITVEQILQMLQFMMTTLQVDPNKFQPVTELLMKEGALLRGWRKSDNALKEKFSWVNIGYALYSRGCGGRCNWWEATAQRQSSTNVCIVNNNGNANNNWATNGGIYAPLCFRIG